MLRYTCLYYLKGRKYLRTFGIFYLFECNLGEFKLKAFVIFGLDNRSQRCGNVARRTFLYFLSISIEFKLKVIYGIRIM